MLTRKQPSHLVDIAVPAEYRVKIKGSKKIEKYLDLARAEKSVKLEGDSDTNNDWHTRNSSQALGKKTCETGNQRKNQDHGIV